MFDMIRVRRGDDLYSWIDGSWYSSIGEVSKKLDLCIFISEYKVTGRFYSSDATKLGLEKADGDEYYFHTEKFSLKGVPR